MPRPPSRLRSHFSELKRRRVLHVAAAYAVVAWIVVQVAVTTFPYLGVPAWLTTALIVIAALGFPLAVVLAWVFLREPEAKPEAVATTSSPTEPVKFSAARVTVAGAAGLVLVGAGIYLARSLPAPGDEAAASEPAMAPPPGARVLAQVTFSDAVEEFPAFAADGKRMVYSRETAGYKQLFVRDLSTGEETQLTAETRDHIQPDWSPDGAAIVFVRASEPGGRLQPADVFTQYMGGSIWRLELASGRTQQLVENAYNPSFSPDGRQIAFDASLAGPRRVWIADAFGRNAVQLTTDASEAVAHIAPDWSPDGTLLVFQNVEKTKIDIRTVDVATRALHWLTDDLFRDVDPAFSPTRREVVFTSNRAGGYNLWRVAVGADGALAGAPQQVTMGAGQDVEPALAPDGRRIAYVTLNQNADLWRLPLSPETGLPAGAPEPVIATTREDSRGAFSPDGRWIAFNSDRTGEMNIWLYSVESGSTRQLTRGVGGDFQPRWSPDGQRVVFFSSRAGNADIWSVDVLTGELAQLTADSALDVNPFFSPDGRRIAFQSDRGGRKEVWLMNADGSEQRRLTTTGVTDHVMLWVGRTVVYTVRAQEGTEQLQVDVETGNTRPFARVRGGAHMSSSRAGTHILDVDGHKVLWLSPIRGGQPTRVFEFEHAEVRIDYPVWSPDGRWVLFDRLEPTGGDVWILELGAPAEAGRT
ncbi:MAG: PD40 domain-containing protein [Gemmatimonadetes bacterium]|nr:PD40 domain-containing protein [Gemmatimonadota bacterium]